MERKQIQILRYIYLRNGRSANVLGLKRGELRELYILGMIAYGPCGYSGDTLRITEKGLQELTNRNAIYFADPAWDDEEFAELVNRESIYTKWKGTKT